MDKQPEMTVEFLKPERLWDSTKIGFSQVVRVRNAGAIVFVAGQTPEDGQRKPMAAGDFEAQARIAFTNLKNALAAAGELSGRGQDERLHRRHRTQPGRLSQSPQ